MEVKVIGQMDNTIDHTFESANRVYDKNGLAPTITTMQGGGIQPMIVANINPSGNGINGAVHTVEAEAPTITTNKGEGEIIINIPRSTSKTNNGKYVSCEEMKLKNIGQKEANTILATYWKGIYGESKNAIIVKSQEETKQSTQETCGVVTSVQGDNLAMETASICIGGLQEHQTPRTDGISPSLTAAMGMGGGQTPIINCQYRIRKLTPRECWRLMDFKDEDFEKAAEVNSSTQLYKQAGNSIVKNVLIAIFGQMIPGKENVYKERR